MGVFFIKIHITRKHPDSEATNIGEEIDVLDPSINKSLSIEELCCLIKKAVTKIVDKNLYSNSHMTELQI
jgi:hypothetical protein